MSTMQGSWVNCYIYHRDTAFLIVSNLKAYPLQFHTQLLSHYQSVVIERERNGRQNSTHRSCLVCHVERAHTTQYNTTWQWLTINVIHRQQTRLQGLYWTDNRLRAGGGGGGE